MTVRPALTLLALVACGGDPSASGVDDPRATDGLITLDWAEGDRFHVAARYREGAVMAEERSVTLDAAAAAAGEAFAEHWTEEVVWTYQVIEAGFVPDADDELFPYAVTGAGDVTALAVVKVTAEEALNTDPEVLAADPTTYLVFREDIDRMVGLISFTTVGDARVEQAWSAGERGRSWSVLSQGNLVKAPTYLAPWSARWEDGERRLESGRFVETVGASDGIVDVFYSDELDGGLVGSRYEPGKPWPTWTVAENVESRLLDPELVEGMRGPGAPPPGDDDLDYRRVLASSIDIDAALRIDQDTIEDEGWNAEVREEYRPWAGAWWPLKKGELVFGYRYTDTISDRIQEEVDPIKLAMDRLSKEIRDMDDDAEGRDARVEEFQTKQKELVDTLVAFYDGIRDDLDAGRLRLEDGELVHDDDWRIPVEDLSPMDKFALVEHLDGNGHPNPWYLPAWEILNSYNPGGESWWGHCNGWSAAAILTNEPVESRTVTVDGHEIEFSTADVKGLLTESHYSTYSRFYGERYNGESDDITDLTPSAFQRLVTFYIKEQGVPLVFDTTASEAVWNFPAWKVELALDETTPEAERGLVDINTADVDGLDALPGIGETLAGRIVDFRERRGPFQDVDGLLEVDGIGEGTLEGLRERATVDPVERTFDAVVEVTLTSDAVDAQHVDTGEPTSFTETWSYALVTDARGTVLRGTWDKEDDHPDFAWVPYNNPSRPQTGGSENPYLDYGHMLEQLGDDLERR